MGKLSKTLTILGGSILEGVAYSLWKDKKDLEEENEELYNEIYGLVRDEIMSKTGKKNNSVDEEEANDNIDELDLGIETLGEVE